MDDFDRLCREQEGLVYRYLLSLCRDGALAEELTAETFYRAYLHIGSFRGECRVETWLCGIARSAFFREQKRQKRLCPQEEAAALPARDDLLERFHDREQALAIHRALHRLKEPGREVFTLRVLGGAELPGDRRRVFQDGILGKNDLLPGKGPTDPRIGGDT